MDTTLGNSVRHSDGHSESRNRVPIFACAVVCSIVAVWCIFTSNLTGGSIRTFPLVLSGILLSIISLFEIRVGLAVVLIAIGLSPEFKVYGVSNFRYEDVLFPVIFLVWVTRHVLAKQKLIPTDLKAPILIILMLSLLSSLNNHIYGGLDLRTACFRFGKSIEYYIILVVVLNCLKTKRDFKGFVGLMLLSSAFVGLYGMIQYNLSASSEVYRLPGPPGETANILGGYFVFHMCIAIGLLTRVTGTLRMLLIGYLLLMAMPFTL
ncbi:MAG: hypothetical protein V3T77_10375, partial [Planctomycetota bacterium]